MANHTDGVCKHVEALIYHLVRRKIDERVDTKFLKYVKLKAVMFANFHFVVAVN